jgi:hypothetical protein
LLADARRASPEVRIPLYRDRIAAYGTLALERLLPWILEPNLAAFAIRTIVRAAELSDVVQRAAVDELKQARRRNLIDAIDRDLVEALSKLKPSRTRSPGSRAIGAAASTTQKLPPVVDQPVAQLQADLERHFADLRKRRPSHLPMFSLEHGLGANDIVGLRDTIGSQPTANSLRSRNWLLWVVHATEIAYRYSGDEYWSSFAAATPRWHDADRPWIRQMFERFASQFGGAKPRGAWAQTFTNIAWPITNAVLPVDLQKHLARALYFARSGLLSSAHSLEGLGRHVASSSWHGSDRFGQLRDQPELLGQIAWALLRPQDVTDALLSRATLERITADLQAERASAIWLRGARRIVEGSTFRLVGARPKTHELEDPNAAVAEAARFLAPEIVLAITSSTCRPWLKLPNLSGLVSTSADVRTSLLSSRCSVPASDNPIAPGALLFDDQRVALARWPTPGTALLQFQGLARGLEGALLSAWGAPALPALFRIHVDGTGRYQRSAAVVPGYNYVVVNDVAIPALEGLSIECGVPAKAYKISVPAAVSAELAHSLRRVGLHVSKSTELRLVGTHPVYWDQDSRIQWLVGDEPVLGIKPSHDVMLLEVGVSGAGKVSRTDLRAGVETLVSMPSLPEGSYTTEIREVPISGPPVTRTIDWRVRQPVRSEAGPVRIWTEPYTRDLADLWDGRCAFLLAGPAGNATMEFALAARLGAVPQVRKTVRLAVPLAAKDWRERFALDFVADPVVAAGFDASRSAELTFDIGRFGRYSFEFEQSLPPLRWTSDVSTSTTTLVDETDATSGPTVWFASFRDPLAFVVVPLGPDNVVPSLGGDSGMLVAESGVSRSQILVAPHQRVFRGFEQLRLDPIIPGLMPKPEALADAGRILEQWSRAPLPGNPIARVWRDQVAANIQGGIVATIAGQAWTKAEEASASEADPLAAGKMRALLRSSSLVVTDDLRSILLDAPRLSAMHQIESIKSLEQLFRNGHEQAGNAWSALVRSRTSGDARRWAAEWTLRVASDPSFAGWAKADLTTGLGVLLAWPLPLRVARFLGFMRPVPWTW